jgi:hypothetical protein
MKAKTIKSSIRWKINDWLKTIDDEEVRTLAEKNVIVTGGCIVSMLTNERVNDYDIYFRTYECAKRVAEYYVERFKQNPPTKFKNADMDVAIRVESTDPVAGFTLPGDGISDDVIVPPIDGRVKIIVKSAGVASENANNEYQYFEGHPDEVGQAYADSVMGDLDAGDDVPASVLDTLSEKPKYRPVFLSGNAITLSDGIQLVTRFIGEPEVIHKYYDFVHCTCYWSSWDSKLVLPAAALEAILTKELRYVGSLYPLCSIIRIRKFVARGWQINAGQILKMCFQLNKLDLTSIPVLEDQLTGVDAAYFVQILDRLKAKQKEDGTEGKPIDGTYLMTIIDRLF